MGMRIYAALVAATFLASCSKQPLSPVQLIGDRGTELAIKEFLMASEHLALDNNLILSYAENPALAPTRRPPSDIFGTPLRQDIAYDFKTQPAEPVDVIRAKFEEKYRDSKRRDEARLLFVDRYIKTGAYASQLLCRNYLSGLRERNEYFEFLQKELRVAGGLATITLELVSANGTLRTAMESGVKALHDGIDAYQEYRFLTPEVETVLPIVELAQVTLRDYFLKYPPSTFAGAVNAVSRIEYTCTRAGIRSLLNKTLVQTQPQFTVKDGILSAVPVKQVTETAKPSEKIN